MALISRETYESLHSLLIHKLQSLYDIEQELLKALPKMQKKTEHPTLQASLERHIKETQSHAERLAEALQSLGETPKAIKSEGIRGIIEDTEWIVAHAKHNPVIDSALLSSAHIVEQLEIVHYGIALSWAKIMGHERVCTLINETLAEEQAMDAEILNLAQKCNQDANTGM